LSFLVEDGCGQRERGSLVGEYTLKNLRASRHPRRNHGAGTRVARDTARVRAQSKPPWTPSVSIEVSRISPAPVAALSRPSTASILHHRRRPRVKTSSVHLYFFRASIASTTACAPNLRLKLRDQGWTADGGSVDADFSAPDSRILRASAMDRMPPPTVSGINTLRAVRATTSAMISRRRSTL